MNLLDLYFKLRYKNIIKELGFNKPTPSILLLPIENRSDYEPSGHYIVLYKEALIKRVKDIHFKKDKQRIIFKFFFDWINSPATLKVYKFPTFAITKERWLYLELEDNLLRFDVSFDFLCTDCNKIYNYNPIKYKLNTDLSKSNRDDENNGVWEIRHSYPLIYNVFYCANKHRIFENIRVRFTV